MSTSERQPAPPLLHRGPRISLTLLIVSALVGVNAFAIGGIFAAQRDARLEAERELRLEVETAARALETRLSDLRSDLLFLAHSPALAESLSRIGSDNPTTRRWSRLDLEGTLLLFMQAQPGIETLTLSGEGGRPVVRVGRRGGYPLLTPPQGRPTPSDRQTVGRFPVAASAPPGSVVEATLRPDALLGQAAPEGTGRIALRIRPEPVDEPGARLSAVAAVRSAGWEPELAWQLVGSEDRSVLVASIDRLSRRLRTTLLLNVGIVVLTLLVGWFLVRQSRRAERLAMESLHQERLRALERRLAHNEKLASLGRMAAGLAHEINNPLEGMSNYLGVLESDLARAEVDSARSRVPRIREGLERAAGVLRRVLVYSKPGSGRLDEEVDLGAVVAETTEFARGLPDLEAVSIRYTPGPLPAIVRGDAGALGQLVLNLLINAGQLQGAGGEIDVAIEVRHDRVLLAVADRGPGIDPGIARRLFEPFRSTRGSSGLGLSVCRSIVREHSGSIRALDRVGGGTTFEVTLPGRADTDRSESTDTGMGASA